MCIIPFGNIEALKCGFRNIYTLKSFSTGLLFHRPFSLIRLLSASSLTRKGDFFVSSSIFSDAIQRPPSSVFLSGLWFTLIVGLRSYLSQDELFVTAWEKAKAGVKKLKARKSFIRHFTIWLVFNNVAWKAFHKLVDRLVGDLLFA